MASAWERPLPPVLVHVVRQEPRSWSGSGVRIELPSTNTVRLHNGLNIMHNYS